MKNDPRREAAVNLASSPRSSGSQSSREKESQVSKEQTSSNWCWMHKNGHPLQWVRKVSLMPPMILAKLFHGKRNGKLNLEGSCVAASTSHIPMSPHVCQVAHGFTPGLKELQQVFFAQQQLLRSSEDVSARQPTEKRRAKCRRKWICVCVCLFLCRRGWRVI